MYLYLDESGDLGFDFENKKPSRFFVITIKERVYSHMTHQILERVPFPAVGYVNLVVDRSKNDLGVREFNDYLYANLSLCLNLETKLYISHDSSEKHKCIQAADLFCYGIARKYE